MHTIHGASNINPEQSRLCTIMHTLEYSTRAAANFFGSSPMIVVAPGCLPTVAFDPMMASFLLEHKSS